MPFPINPYVAGNPVGDSPAFIGRADVWRETVRVLRRPQENALVLFGQRRIGKTSVLQYLEAHLRDEGAYLPVYFDLQDKAEWPLARVLRALAQEIAFRVGIPAPAWDEATDVSEAFLTWLSEALDALPEVLPPDKGELERSLVLLFDEFDVLADPEGEQAAGSFFPYLRQLMAQDRARLQFIFVIGRNVDDLDTIALSLFKGTPYRRVSLLSKNETAKLVRLSEANGTLNWPKEAVARVWALTNGHPFLTQQLCSHTWEHLYAENPDEAPTVSPADVDAVADDALEASRNTLEWLWDGLGPAERVVASALAEAGPGPITQAQLEQILQESGVRVIIRELQNAPQLLQEWDIIEPADGGPSAEGYRFRVELLRRWIAEHKPLSRVQEEMDRIEPVADNYYDIGLRFYRSGNLEEAIEPLERAVKLNPNHIGANQLLADVYLAQDQADQARQLLERLEAYHPAAVRSRLIQAILAQAEAAKDEDTRLALYKDVLTRNPTQREALAEAQRIHQRRERLVLQIKQREELIVPKLSVWNPLDYLRLLLWLFTMPAKLKIHRETFGKKEEKRIGRLISNLALLPLLTLIGGLALGNLPSATFSTKSYFKFNIIYIIILIIYDIFGDPDDWPPVLMMCIGGGTGILILVSLPSIITELVQISTATVAVAGIASIIGINIMGIVTSILGVDSFTHSISFISEILGILMIGIAFGWTGIIVAIAVSIIVLVYALILWYEVEKSIKSGQPTWITKGALGLLALSQAFLIWFSFLGGWRVFAPAS